MFAGKLDSDIAVVDPVSFDDDVLSAVHVESVGAAVRSIGRIAVRRDVVDDVVCADAVARLVQRGGRAFALKAYEIDADVVVVVDLVVGDDEVLYVAVEHHALAPPGLASGNLVAVDGDVAEGSRAVGAIDGDAMTTGFAGGIDDVGHRVVADLDEAAGASHPDARLKDLAGASDGVLDRETDDLHKGPVLDVHKAADPAQLVEQSGAVDDRPRLAAKGDVLAGGPGPGEGDTLVVGPRPDLDGVARLGGVQPRLDRRIRATGLGHDDGLPRSGRGRLIVRTGSRCSARSSKQGEAKGQTHGQERSRDMHGAPPSDAW